MNTSNIDILQRLGLSEPKSIGFESTKFTEAYFDFCRGLETADFLDVILADPWFSPNEGLSDPDAKDLERLRLYAALIRPDRDCLKHLFSRTFLVDQVLQQQGRFTGHVYAYGIGRSFREFARFPGTGDARKLMDGCVPLQVLDHLHGEIASAPGLTWFTDLQMITWTPDWGIALHYFDAENDQGDAFPRLLGFFRMDTYPFSAARLLTRIPEEFSHQEGVYLYGDDLLSFCWVRWGVDGEFNIGGHLMALPDTDIAELRKHNDGFSATFAADMRDLWRALSDDFDCDYGVNILKRSLENQPVTVLVDWLNGSPGHFLTKATPWADG